MAKKERKKHNNSIEMRIITGCFSLVFVAMIAYLCYFVDTNEQEIINNSYNSRQEILLTKNYRGSIFASDGTVLAETILDGEGNEKRVYPHKGLFSHIVDGLCHCKEIGKIPTTMGIDMLAFCIKPFFARFNTL